MQELTGAANRWSVEDHVSLADRLTALLWSRVALAVGTITGGLLLTGAVTGRFAAAAAAFALLFLIDLRTRARLNAGVRPSQRVLVLGVLLEGLALVVAVYLAGGAAGPLRYALVIHAAITSLLLSREIGVRSAVWVSLLLMVSHEMQELGLVHAVDQLDGSRLSAGPELNALLLAIWLTTLLTASASAINERVLLRERLEQHIHASFGQAAEAAREPAETARVLAEHVMRASAVAEVLVVDMRTMPTVLARLGSSSPRRGSLGKRDGSLLERMLTTRTAVHVRQPDPDLDRELLSLLGDPLNVSAVPMIAGDGVVGALIVVHGDSASRGLQRRTVEGYHRLAAHGALALANAWSAEALDRQARTDGLTGVANRRVFDEQFDIELQRARRERSPISLVLCDVDNFKRFNDTHGHQVGDRVLTEVAAALQDERRPYDIVARYGGEEFVVILSQTGYDGAMRAAERLRRSVEDAGEALGVTASFGVASSEDGLIERTELISMADNQLYMAKENGRNRVEGTYVGVPATEATDEDLIRQLTQSHHDSTLRHGDAAHSLNPTSSRNR